jgi:adenylyltransferase/sulfurtransferase
MLSEKELTKYDRQMILHDWGIKAQERLKRTSIAVVGSGGLGSPASIYLVAAGFGRVLLADMDRVDLSNLNRQVLHWDEDVGVPKVLSATAKLRRLNPDVEVLPILERITPENVDELLGDVHGVVDALDNVPSRYVLNDFVLRKGVPLFHGAVWGLEGRATVIVPGETPCLRCIIPEPPPREVFPVVGVTPGLIAMIQVTEAIKFFTGIGEVLAGDMLVYDGERMDFMRVQLSYLPECPACGGRRGE